MTRPNVSLAMLVLAMGGQAWCADNAAPSEGNLADLRRRMEEQDRRIDQQQKVVDQLTADRTRSDANLRAEWLQTIQLVRAMAADANGRSGVPGWMENLTFGGDLRLRYQGEFFNWGASAGSERKDRNRARFRLRAGLTKTWLEGQLEVGFRLASGNSSDPTSTEQTFGESSSGEQPFAKRPVWIDLAYAKYSPKGVKGLTLVGGKMASPWRTNDLFFDTDINPEGFWAEYKAPALGAVELFAGAGYFVLTERAGTSVPEHDSTEFGEQTGAAWTIGPGMKDTVAAYHQSYQHYGESTARALGNSSPLSLVPGFKVVGIVNHFEFTLGGLPVDILAEWAHSRSARPWCRRASCRRPTSPRPCGRRRRWTATAGATRPSGWAPPGSTVSSTWWANW